MDVNVADNPGQGRFEARIGDELVGVLAYRRSRGRIAFLHTETAEEHEGEGVGGALAAAALAAARSEALGVLPFCPFIRGYIARHPEYLDLVPDEERGRFDL